MLRKIKLYGELAEFVGHKEFEVQVDSLQKAVSFLVNNFPQVEAYMNPKYYQVKVGNYAIDESEIHHPIGKEDIHFVPVITGASRIWKNIIRCCFNWVFYLLVLQVY
jgi:predicted phage tail protein